MKIIATLSISVFGFFASAHTGDFRYAVGAIIAAFAFGLYDVLTSTPTKNNKYA